MLTQLAFWFLVAHFVCDYPLQGDFLARGKGSFAEPLYGVPWWHCMTAHSMIHAGGVALVVGLITGNWTWAVVMGAAEAALHFVIDVMKCRKITGINTDQALHVVCKVGYTFALGVSL